MVVTDDTSQPPISLLKVLADWNTAQSNTDIPSKPSKSGEKRDHRIKRGCKKKKAREVKGR